MNEFNLPIQLKIPKGLTFFYFLGICFFTFLAFLSVINVDGIGVTTTFLFFVILNVFTFISSRSSIEINGDSIILKSPPRGQYQIEFSEIEYIETNGQIIGFFGNNKRLAITLGFAGGKGMSEFYGFFNKFVRENNIEVRPLSSRILTQKNTKIRNLFY